jgi:Trypsin
MKHVLNLTVLACLLFAISSCSQEKKSNYSLTQKSSSASIINGVVVPEDNELGKSTVGLLIQVKDTWYQGCTGSIIAKNMILTAAHCLHYLNASRDNLVVTFSLDTVDNEAQENIADPKYVADVRKVFKTVDVANVIAHPKYDGTVDYDVAVIRLKTDIPQTHKPVEFLPDLYFDPTGAKLWLDGKIRDVTLLGFGLISEETGESSTVLRMTTVPAKFDGAIVVTDQTHGTGACNGDSGGPAFLNVGDKSYLVGVTHGPYLDYETCHEFGAYLNPNLFLDFIYGSIDMLNAIVL